jgi:hypothetical protein
MTDHKAIPVKGYTDQAKDKIDLVNENKILEERCMRQLERLAHESNANYDMLDQANMRLREAFMWANRAVFKPERVSLPEDPDPAKDE